MGALGITLNPEHLKCAQPCLASHPFACKQHGDTNCYYGNMVTMVTSTTISWIKNVQ